jgi:hypothetical protein
MKKIFAIALLLLMSSMAWAHSPLATAIARAEGFGASKKNIPTRYHNPGDIRASRGVHYPGQAGLNKHGYVIFRDDKAGWAALEDQLNRIVTGESRFYTVNDSLQQMARKYATSRTWVRNVAHILGVTPGTSLWQILDVPPVVMARSNPHELDFLLGGAQ